jgi:hypothetical protein
VRLRAKVAGEKIGGYDGEAASIDQHAQIMKEISAIRSSKKAWTPAFAKIHANFVNLSTNRLQALQQAVRALRWVKIKTEAYPSP